MSEPNGQRYAHVQVLTAEVRTLMVGSRQVTLSVYNQLDFVPHSQIKPFGRVNPKEGDRHALYVVGKDKAGGSLVRARTPYKGEELDREPFARDAKRIGTDAFEAICGAGPDALEGIVADAVNAFARLIRAGFFHRGRAMDNLTECAQEAGLRAAGQIVEDIADRIRELGEGAERGGGALDDRALLVVHAYEQADADAEFAVTKVKTAWSKLPLIVLAGLR